MLKLKEYSYMIFTSTHHSRQHAKNAETWTATRACLVSFLAQFPNAGFAMETAQQGQLRARLSQLLGLQAF